MLGPRIAALRRAAGWSQAELAQLLKISPSAVGMYEQGRREPALALVVAMAKTFGVTTDYLLTGSTNGAQDETAARQALMRCVEDARQRLGARRGEALSKDELVVLFAAMLLES